MGIRMKRFGWIVALLALTCGSGVASAVRIDQLPLQGTKDFFTSVPDAMRKAANAPGVKSQALPVAFNANDMLGLAEGDEVGVNLPNGRRYAVTFHRAESHGGGIVSWVGYLKGRGDNNRVILTNGPAGSFGLIDTPDGSWRVVPGDGHDWLVDMTEEQMHIPVAPFANDVLVPPPMPKAVQGDIGVPTFRDAMPTFAKVATPKALAVIDVMVVLTQTLADRLGATAMTRLYFLMTTANTSYTNSGVGMSVRLVNVAVVNYPDSGTDDVPLNAITPTGGGGTGVFANIETLRAQSGADLVSFMRNGSSFGGSGIAWLGNTSPNPLIMYSVVTGCVLGCESVFIHEMGHNMGNRHDRPTNAFQNGGINGGAFPAYSFGYPFCKSGAYTCSPNIAAGTPGTCTVSQPECSTQDPSNFVDIMGYFQGSAQKIYKFSNPNVTCAATGGDLVARPCGVDHLIDPANGANTALSMNNNAAAMSAVKTAVSGPNAPGSIQFTQLGYSGSEAGGTINFTVSRLGGTGGAISATYTVASGSATSGIDFPASSGTVSWADLDGANKTISIPIRNDLATEGNETFTVTLSNPTGAAGVFLGLPRAATGIITEQWPPGGTFPAGFTATPVGSTAPWAASTDANFDGDGFSLKSGAVSFTAGTQICDASGNVGAGSLPCPSVTSFTGNFAAGTLAFAYKVSGYPGFGFFEFLLDGATVVSGTGANNPPTADSGWQLFSAPITAGSHTLQWRYRTALTFPCASAIPTGSSTPPYPSCADRAWLDAVTFPLPLTATSTLVVSNGSPSNLGQPVTFTATVSPASSTGTAAFFDGGNPIAGCTAITVVSGSAQCPTNALTAGVHSITAAYSGTTSFAASLSPAISQTVNAQQTLSVTKSGAGTGTVTSSPAGINCGATCSLPFNAGTPVTLTAAAAGGSVFAGWTGGGCSGTGTCLVTLNAATTVNAMFVAQSGSATAMANPATLDFGNESMGATTPAQTVTITNIGTTSLTISNIASNNAQFAQTNTCTVALTAGASCTMAVSFTPAIGAGALLSTVPVAAAITITSNGAGSPNSVPLTGTGEKSLVSHYYRSILRRLPDAGGKTFWEGEASRMQTLGVNVNETWYSMAGSFYTSAEYLAFGRDNTGFVTDLYNTFFNRPPDGAGLTFWTGQIASGMPREVVLVGFMFSTEFVNFTQAIFGNATVRKEIDTVVDFYRGILGRLPDSGGFAFWLQQFRTAQCAGASAVTAQAESISSQFALSGEYAARARANPQYVGDLYNAFLRRGGDLAGVQFWITQVSGAQTREQVRQAFVASPEFQARVQAVIAQGCLP